MLVNYCITLAPTFIYDSKTVRESTFLLTQKLRAGIKLKLRDYDDNVIGLEIFSKKRDIFFDNHLTEPSRHSNFYADDYLLLKLNTKTKYLADLEKGLRENFSGMTKGEIRYNAVYIYTEEIISLIETVIFASHFAYPGALKPVQIISFYRSKLLKRSEARKSEIADAISFFDDNGISLQSSLDFEDAVIWVLSKNGMVHGVSDTPVSKSLNYFTRLFVHSFRDDELSDLVWSLAGVEALLVDGGRSSVGQLNAKIPTFFAEGKQNWIKAEVENAYKVRSKLVHGNKQIRSSYRSNEDNDSAFDENYSAHRFSAGVHFALLLTAALSGATEFKFRTTPEPLPTSVPSWGPPVVEAK
ncbi:hypothetical protein [Bosea sp. (in: a-proteobacteria)]|uniref:hypothetical protein n=1 Tax=Bosea sp. (in: a-proteobacteria) TaxID=1871050 RepID=UPI0040342C52